MCAPTAMVSGRPTTHACLHAEQVQYMRQVGCWTLHLPCLSPKPTPATHILIRLRRCLPACCLPLPLLPLPPPRPLTSMRTHARCRPAPPLPCVARPGRARSAQLLLPLLRPPVRLLPADAQLPAGRRAGGRRGRGVLQPRQAHGAGGHHAGQACRQAGRGPTAPAPAPHVATVDLAGARARCIRPRRIWVLG